LAGGIQLSRSFSVSRQRSQTSREASVSRFSSRNPCARAKPQGAFADEQAMVGPFHHALGDQRRVADAPQAGDGAPLRGRAVHHAAVQFDDAVLVRQPAEADRVVARIVFGDVHGGDRGVQGVGAGPHPLHGASDGSKPVAGIGCVDAGDGAEDAGGPGRLGRGRFGEPLRKARGQGARRQKCPSLHGEAPMRETWVAWIS